MLYAAYTEINDFTVLLFKRRESFATSKHESLAELFKSLLKIRDKGV